MNRVLEGKYAAVFGAAGSIGAAVARKFAAEGAKVFLAGRTKSKLEEVMNQIAAAEGQAYPTVLDALDDAAVLIASDSARMLTGTVVDASAGAALD